MEFGNKQNILWILVVHFGDFHFAIVLCPWGQFLSSENSLYWHRSILVQIRPSVPAKVCASSVRVIPEHVRLDVERLRWLG